MTCSFMLDLDLDLKTEDVDLDLDLLLYAGLGLGLGLEDRGLGLSFAGLVTSLILSTSFPQFVWNGQPLIYRM